MAWPLGWLSDRLDRRIVIIGTAIAASASLFAMSVLVPVSASPLLLYICVALLGAMIVPTYSIVLAHVNDAVARNEFVAASSGLLIVQGVGAVAGPLVAGAAMATWPKGLTYTLIATQLLIVFWGLYRFASAPLLPHKGTFLVEPPVPVGNTFAPARLKFE
jgi:MFS family permease